MSASSRRNGDWGPTDQFVSSFAPRKNAPFRGAKGDHATDIDWSMLGQLQSVTGSLSDTAWKMQTNCEHLHVVFRQLKSCRNDLRRGGMKMQAGGQQLRDGEAMLLWWGGTGNDSVCHWRRHCSAVSWINESPISRLIRAEHANRRAVFQ